MLHTKSKVSILIIFIMAFNLLAKKVTDDQKILYIDEQIRFADGLVERGHFDLAIEEYIRLTKKFADDPIVAEAWMQLAEAYAAKKDFKAAIETFEAFLNKFPKIRIVPAAKLKYALVLHQTGESDNVKKAFQMLELLKNSSASPEVIKDAASFYLARLYIEDQQFDNAVAELRGLAKKKIHKSPEHDFRASAVIKLAELYINQSGNTKDAITALSAISSKKGLSPSIMTKVQWSLGDLYYNAKDYRKAAETFAKFAILFPENPIVKDAMYKRLQSLYMMKDYSKVISETDRILKGGIPKERWERFYCIKASALIALRFYKRALESLDIVIAKSKKKQMVEFAAYKYLEAQIKNKDIDAALKTAEKYILNEQFSPRVAKDMALLIADNAGKTDSEKILETAISKCIPDSENSIILKLKLASILIVSGKNKEALKLYRELSSTPRKEFRAYAVMGEAQTLENLGNINEAADRYKYLIKEYPKSELYREAMLRIAVLLLADKKQWETSKIYLKELKKRFPDKPTAKLATFYQGYLAFYEKDYNHAKEILSGVLNSKNITPDLKQDIEIYLIWSLIRLKDIKSVILIFKSVKNPESLLQKSNFKFLNELGNTLLKDSPAISIMCFNELLKRKNKKAVQLGYLGSAKVDIENGDLVRAIEKLQKASDLEADPRVTSEALMKLGILLAERGKPDDAVIILEKCIDTAVDKQTSNRVYFELAKILSKQPERLKAANRYAMKSYILSKDKNIRSQSMLLSIEISLKQKKRLAADKTWQDFKKNFPELLDSERAKEIRKILED